MLLAGNIDPMVENAKVIIPFDRFDLLPGNRYKRGIQVYAGEIRQDGICLLRGAGRGVAEFAAEDEEAFTLYVQLFAASIHADGLLIGRLRERRERREHENQQN